MSADAALRVTGRRDLGPILLPLLGVGVLLGLWEGAPRAGFVDDGTIPPLSAVVVEAGHVLADPSFRDQVGASAPRWAAGLLIAILAGVPLGLCMGRSRALFHALDPLLTVSYPVPKAALILLFTLWWGAGDVSRVAIIVTGTIIPLVISAYHGARGVPPRLLWSARALGTSRVGTLAKVVLPAALPQVLSGLRLALAVSLFTGLASELLIRRSGVGAYMFTNLDVGEDLRVWACALLIAITGFALDRAYVALVGATMRWLEHEP